MAVAAHAVWFHRFPHATVPEVDRRLAPRRALGTVALMGIVVAGLWAGYQLRGAG